MKLELTQKLQQQQILAPQMILSMDVLLLSAQELQTRIEKEFVENPALEIKEETRQPAAGTEAPAAGASKSAEEPGFGKLESFESQYVHRYYDGAPRRSRSDSQGGKQEFLQNTEGKPPGLKDYLLRQLHVSNTARQVQDVAEQIIQNLDHRGYLLCSEEEIYDEVKNSASHEDFEQALDAVRHLDPPGVGAEDLQHCLLLQLQRDPQEYPLETQIISRHLEDLGQNKIPKIARELGTTIDEIKDALEIITALNPLPGSQYEASPTIYTSPDIIVETVDGKLEVRLADGSTPNLAVSDSCRKILKESRGNREVTSFLRRKIESAQWLINAIRQRQRTLYDIAVTVVGYQKDFMENGPHHLRAMRMQTIADMVGVHISTVSRAIKGKSMQTPWGVFDMRYFFTGGVSKADGEVESRRNVYRLIGEIIENEDKRHPCSDAEIARRLKAKGLEIARRTVTKYREQEKIPSSRGRRTY